MINMWGLEDLPFPVKLLIAFAFDIIDAMNMIPGAGDMVETPVNAVIAYILTDKPIAALANGVDGIIPAPLDMFPTATALVLADHFGWI